MKNTVLFAVGNFGSKLLQVLLVPFYTRVMTDAEYGTVDFLQAVVSLLLPVASLAIYEGVFRYAMDRACDKREVLSAGVFVTLCGAVFLCVCGGLVSLVRPVAFLWLVIWNAIMNSARTLLSQYTRAINRTVLFSVDNILMTFVVLILNITLIAGFRMGVTGYMLGYIGANAFSCVFLLACLGKSCRIRFGSVRRATMRELLLFSLPLIPNAICWWLSNFMDRIMIISMVSTAANGLYAAAHKIPSLLSVVVTIFFQAWQMSANEEFEKKDIADFYSKIFEQISACSILLASVLILCSRPITAVFLGADYGGAWLYMPPLLLSMTFFSFAQFLGSIYSANKKTKMALVTNAVAVAVNVSLNFILIRAMGTIGAAVATAVSYLVLWLVRVWDTGKIVPVQYRLSRLVPALIILVLQAVFVCADLDLGATYACCAAGTVCMVVLFRKTLVELVRFFGAICRKILIRR